MRVGMTQDRRAEAAEAQLQKLQDLIKVSESNVQIRDTQVGG